MQSLEPTPKKPETIRKIELKDILTYENPHMADYHVLIEEAARRSSKQNPKPLQSPWGFEWSRLTMKDHKEEVSFLRTKLNDTVLVDLAAGPIHKRKEESLTLFSEGVYDFAERNNVGLYIGVEKHLDASLGQDVHTDVIDVLGMSPSNKMKSLLVQNDALDFIARMKSSATANGKPVNITVNGLDNWVLDYPEYHQALAKEITRVVPTGGIIFGVKSSVVTYLGAQKELKSLKDSSLLKDHYVLGEHAKGNAEYYYKGESPEFQQNRYYMVDSEGHPLQTGYFIFEKKAV